MPDISQLLQKLFTLSSEQNSADKIIELSKKILQQLEFSCTAPITTAEQQYFYASYGTAQPHILFIADLFSLPHEKEQKANQTAFSCFIAACTKLITSKTNIGKISIFIPIGNKISLPKTFNNLMLNRKNIDFCIIGKANYAPLPKQVINIGSLGDILFHITSFGDSRPSRQPADNIKNNNAVQNLLNLLYKLKNSLLDSGSENFSSSTINILSLCAEPPYPLHIPETATATIHIRYNNNHTPQKILHWMQNNINFTNGSFELHSEQLSTPYISDINTGITLLKQAITDKKNRPLYQTNCTSKFADFIKDYCPFAEFGINNSTTNHEDSKLQEIYFQFLFNYFDNENFNQQTSNF